MNKKVGQNQLNAKLIKFLQYYDDFKIKELDNRILFRLFEQEEKIKKEYLTYHLVSKIMQKLINIWRICIKIISNWLNETITTLTLQFFILIIQNL